MKKKSIVMLVTICSLLFGCNLRNENTDSKTLLKHSLIIKSHDTESGVISSKNVSKNKMEFNNYEFTDILSEIYHINSCRIIIKNDSLRESRYDIQLIYEDLSSERKTQNIFSEMLMKEFAIKIEQKNIDTLVNLLSITDSNKLEKYLNNSRSTGSSEGNEFIKYDGITIPNFINNIENKYGVIIDFDVKSNKKYNLTLLKADFNKASELLKNDYGISIELKQNQTKMLIVE